jgi:hypothetical protein
MKSRLYRGFYLFNTIIAFQYKSYTVKPVLNRTVSLDDFRIMIIDVDTRKIVRTFNGHQNVITDLVRIYILMSSNDTANMELLKEK